MEICTMTTSRLKKKLEELSDNLTVPKKTGSIKDQLSTSFKSRFSIKETDESDHITLVLDGRKNLNRIKSDIDACIEDVGIQKKNKDSLLDINIVNKFVDVRLRRV